MVVRMKRGVTLEAISACLWGDGGLYNDLMLSTTLILDGANQRVAANNVSRPPCAVSRPIEKGLLRKMSSPTKRQLTVHLNRKTLENSKAREA